MIFDLFHITSVLIESLLQKQSLIPAIYGGYQSEREEKI